MRTITAAELQELITAAVKTATQELTAEIAELKKRIDDLEKEQGCLREELNGAEEDIDALQTELRDKVDQSDYEYGLGELEERVDDLEHTDLAENIDWDPILDEYFSDRAFYLR